MKGRRIVMIIRKKTRCKQMCNCGTEKYPVDQSIPALEAFIKEEIMLTKTCGCPHCSYRRKMFRGIQYLIDNYKLQK